VCVSVYVIIYVFPCNAPRPFDAGEEEVAANTHLTRIKN